jgi:hypothetical protein
MITGSRAESNPVILQAALRKVTDALASELIHPTHVVPAWSDFEWRIARAVAAMHGVSPLLSRALRWRGPAGWNRFLEEQRAHTANRHARIAKLLQRIDRRMREAALAAVALKGAALHAMELYAVGDRPMADIDLLVRPADAAATANLLGSLGYLETSASWKERVFVPVEFHAPGSLGEHSDNIIKIELHERICEKLPFKITDASASIFPARPHPGLNAYPSKTALMIHLLLHAAGSMVQRTLRLLHLEDLARLASKMTNADWEELLAHGSRDRPLWWAYPPLQIVSRYYGRIPCGVLASLAENCPRRLRRLAERRTLCDLSCSYVWVNAFPGIEWSRSLPELLRYVSGRLRPDSQHRILREHAAATEAWANNAPWAKFSQSRRILRWLTSHPTRPVTMHAVCAALAESA